MPPIDPPRIHQITTRIAGAIGMTTNCTVLTREERDILLLVSVNGRHPDNAEIAQRLGISVSRVKTLLRNACIKLEANNRIEALFLALKRGEISLGEFYSCEELVQLLGSLNPEMLRAIAHAIRQGLWQRHRSVRDEPIVHQWRDQEALLTKREREVLILVGRGLTHREIADGLCLSLVSVGIFINRACQKLGTQKEADAVMLAVKQGEIGLSEFYSYDELTGLLSSLSPHMLRTIAQPVCQGIGQGHLPVMDEPILHMDRGKQTLLTKREREILTLAGRGLTNREISDCLCLSSGSVRIFIDRACKKLGVNKRADAVVLAVKQREIGVGDIFSFKELLQLLAPLGAEFVEEIAQRLDQEPGREPVPTGS